MSKKKKILFINGHLNVGGVEKSLTDILRQINYERFDVELLLLEEAGDYLNDLPKTVRISLKSLKNTYGSFWASIRRCLKKRDWFSLRMRFVFLLMKFFGQDKIRFARNLLTERKHYDIVVGFRPGICTQIAAYAVYADKKIAWWHHGEFNVSKDEYVAQLKQCITLVSVSNSCTQMLVAQMPEIADKIVVIPNMIDSNLLAKKSDVMLPYTQKITELVTVGRLVPEKHISNVIYAAKRLKIAGFLFQWHIVGDGLLRDFLQKEIIDENVADYVILEGAKENPYPYIKNANIYVHPSYVESQGITILEAMALHVPCVVTKSRGPCEFVQDGVNGLLVDQSPQALTNGVRRLLEDEQLYAKIKSGTVCPSQFAVETVMQKIYNLFE